MKKVTKEGLLRLGMLIAATVLLIVMLPHTDSLHYNYEMNQPWRYPLLMADFDMEVKRDSASAQQLRDSIDRAFVPIVKRDDQVADSSVRIFSNAIARKTPHASAAILSSLLRTVYAHGVVDSRIYSRLTAMPQRQVRMANSENGADALITVSADGMLSPAKAFEYIDSAYYAAGLPPLEENNEEVAQALNAVLVPNIVLDTQAEQKFRAQEYLAADASIGVIKKGQRIVDRGEIVTPQIYTNLNNYILKANERTDSETASTYYYVGQTLYILICLVGLYLFLRIFRPRFYASIKKMSFLLIMILLFVFFGVVMFEYFANGIYLVPFAAVPVLILVFFDSRTAIFSVLVTILLAALVSMNQMEFIFLELSAGMAAAFSIRNLSQRSQLLRTALITFFTYVLAYLAMTLLTEGTLKGFEWRIVGLFAINSTILSFVYIMILVIEKLFGFTSTVTLVELSDINNPTLRRLAEEAPGTFQHSMQVSMLSAEAARAIGANTQLVRTGALYHDIGKLESPIFFTENQHGVNPHNGLDPEVSAQKIISHVTQGMAMARKMKLPKMVADFIPEHHGHSLARYFYNTAVNNADADHPVDKSKFTYPGPNPRSRETSIVMLADSVEAASRSLKDYTPQSINNLVDKIVDGKVEEGLLRDSDLSFHDIELIKNSFKKRLGTIYHPRVAYPELKSDKQPAEAQPGESTGPDAGTGKS